MTRPIFQIVLFFCCVLCTPFVSAQEKYRIEGRVPAGKYRTTIVSESEIFCVSDNGDWDAEQETRLVSMSEFSDINDEEMQKYTSTYEELQTTLAMPWKTMEYDSRYKDKQDKNFIPMMAAWLGVEVGYETDDQGRNKNVTGLDRIYDKLVKSHNRKAADMWLGGFKESPEDYAKNLCGKALYVLRNEPKAVGDEWEDESTYWTISYGNCKYVAKHVLKSVDGDTAVLETKETFVPISDVVPTLQGKKRIEFFENETTTLTTFELKTGIIKSVQIKSETTEHSESIPDENSGEDIAPVKEIMTTRGKATITTEKIE